MTSAKACSPTAPQFGGSGGNPTLVQNLQHTDFPGPAQVRTAAELDREVLTRMTFTRSP